MFFSANQANQQSEFETVSESLICFIASNRALLQTESSIEIYNEWSHQTDMWVSDTNLLSWALGYIDYLKKTGLPENIEILPELLREYRSDKR